MVVPRSFYHYIGQPATQERGPAERQTMTDDRNPNPSTEEILSSWRRLEPDYAALPRVARARKAARRIASMAHAARIAACIAAVQVHVTRGTCPDCGTKLVRNSAMAGWWQCGAYATEAFRAPEFKGLPSCHWQGFTE